MNRKIKIVLLIFVCVIIQTSILAHFSFFGSKISLPLALTISIALLKGPFYGELVGFFSGLLCDLSSGGPFIGIQAFSLTLIGYFIGLMQKRFYSESIITQLISGFSATIADKIITMLILGALLSGYAFPKFRLLGLLLILIINPVLTIIVYRFSVGIFKGEN